MKNKLLKCPGDHSPMDKSEIIQIVMILSWPQLPPNPSSSLHFSHLTTLSTEQPKLAPTSGPLHIVPFAWNPLPSDSVRHCFLFSFCSLIKYFLTAVGSINLHGYKMVCSCHLIIFFFKIYYYWYYMIHIFVNFSSSPHHNTGFIGDGTCLLDRYCFLQISKQCLVSCRLFIYLWYKWITRIFNYTQRCYSRTVHLL